eukprot:scaffold7338_cov107-Cylindrotheca_fusiformis.AAC.5
MPLLDDLAGSIVGALREVLLPLEPDGSLGLSYLSVVPLARSQETLMALKFTSSCLRFSNTMKLVQRMVSNSRGYAIFKVRVLHIA